MNDVAKRRSGAIIDYDPKKGLKTIVVAEAAEKHWARAKDPEKLYEAIEAKLEGQREYVIWRDSLELHGGDRKSRSRLQYGNLDQLPASDPGDVTAHRWRKKLKDLQDYKQALGDEGAIRDDLGAEKFRTRPQKGQQKQKGKAPKCGIFPHRRFLPASRRANW